MAKITSKGLWTRYQDEEFGVLTFNGHDVYKVRVFSKDVDQQPPVHVLLDEFIKQSLGDLEELAFED